MRDRFAKDYIIVMLETARMNGGRELANEVSDNGANSSPWSVILDANGEPKITSVGPEGNCGCPAAPAEIDHFLAMLDATRRHMSDADRTIIERELRDYAKTLLRDKRPGDAGYRKARTQVMYGQFATAIVELEEAISAGFPAHAIPSDPALRPLREDPELRPKLFALMQRHVTADAIRMIDSHEVGRRMRLDGRVVDMKTGEPIAGAVMQLYHTDATGEYRPGMDAGGGAGNPRLFGYLRTNADGCFTVDTIMPERYPNSTVPRHVHYKVWAEGYSTLVSECFFDSDPNLTDETRASAPERNFPIVTLATDSAQRSTGELVVRVPR